MAEIDILSINNKKIQDVEARKDIKTIKENQINLIEDDTSMEGISDSVHDTLTTDAKKIIPAINEVNDKFKDIANLFTTEQTTNSYKIKCGNKVIAEIPLGSTAPTVTTYTITNTLSNATNSNTVTSVEENTSYSATITANNGYQISSVIVTMGGVDITSSVYSNGTITISNVTGNIVITVITEVDTDVVVGNIDSNKNISLTGLGIGTYTLKYEDDNGIISNYDTIATMEVS